MTRAAPRPALRAGLAALACVWLAGCAALPFGREAAPADGATAAPSRAQYRVEVDAPDELRKLLTDYLDLSRFQNAPDTEAIDATELTRLAAAAPAQARTLLETEGYFSAEVQTSRAADAGGVPVVRVIVKPGPRSVIRSVNFAASGELQTQAVQPGSEAALLLERLRRDWPLAVGQPFRQSAWAAAKTTTLARVRAEGYPAAAWQSSAAKVDAADHSVELAVELDSGALYRLGALRIEGL